MPPGFGDESVKRETVHECERPLGGPGYFAVVCGELGPIAQIIGGGERAPVHAHRQRRDRDKFETLLVTVLANRVRDFAIYIAIGLCLGLLCVWFALDKIDVKWLSLTFETCLVFGCAIGALRRQWRVPVFWISLVVFFIVHLTAFVFVLQQVREWRAPIVGLMFVIETAAIMSLCELITQTWRNKKKER
jgi:hypothetical protein